ncbi:hypothetical protein HDU92_007773 [Lobulomyces angularis]|nr:hypothetical protein HDU92_007773 [Lobulomyces angularis]
MSDLSILPDYIEERFFGDDKTSIYINTGQLPTELIDECLKFCISGRLIVNVKNKFILKMGFEDVLYELQVIKYLNSIKCSHMFPQMIASCQKDYKDTKSCLFIMKIIKGSTLSKEIDNMTIQEVIDISLSIRKLLSLINLQNIKNIPNITESIYGDKLPDHILRTINLDAICNYKKPEEYYTHLENYISTKIPKSYISLIMKGIKLNSKIRFTHGDLNFNNIIINNGQLAGIIDWEQSGFYPQEWEGFKCFLSIDKWNINSETFYSTLFDSKNITKVYTLTSMRRYML